MSVNEEVAKAFVGKRSPLPVKVKGSTHRIIVDFGEIKIPRTIIKPNVDFEKLEDKYSCVFRGLDEDEKGLYISVFPKDTLKFQVLASCDDDQNKTLLDWLKKNISPLLREILARG